MADIITSNVAEFQWTPASGNPDLYETEIWTSYLSPNQHTTVWWPEIHIGWPIPGINNEFQIRARAHRTDTIGEITHTGAWSEWSDPAVVIPVPEPSNVLLLVCGIILLLIVKGLYKICGKFFLL